MNKPLNLLANRVADTPPADDLPRDETIYQNIFQAILEHRLMPGVRLPEDALAETFGVSRTVIRKVLHRLALERLVTIQPNRGACVAMPSVKEARDVFAARRLVESAALESVVALASREQLRELRRIVERERQANAAHDHRDAIQLSALFHVRLVTIADNTELTDFVARLTSRSSLIIAVYGSRKSVGCQCGDHEELIDLIEARDSQGARAWMERHLEEIEASLNFGGEESSVPDFKKIFAELSSRQQSPWR